MDAGTVFQIASLSKPIASTLVASLVSTGNAHWDDRIRDLDPNFQLSDSHVSDQLTIRDLFSHGDLFTYFFAAESNTGVRGVRFSTENGVRKVKIENLVEASNIFTLAP